MNALRVSLVVRPSCPRRHDLTLQINLRYSIAKCRQGNIAKLHYEIGVLYGGSQRIDARRHNINKSDTTKQSKNAPLKTE